MCPGGWIVPASTENDEVVVNGMSLSRRDSPFANSGMVATVEPEDLQNLVKEHGVLAGLVFQKELERTAKQAGGGGQVAPGQRATDFLTGKISASLPDTSYFPGIKSAPLHELLPQWITSRMREGLRLFGRQMHGYVSERSAAARIRNPHQFARCESPAATTRSSTRKSTASTPAARARATPAASSAPPWTACASRMPRV